MKLKKYGRLVCYLSLGCALAICVWAAPQASSMPEQDSANKSTGPAGEVRAYDVRTGKHRWTFRIIPTEGDPGIASWDDDSWKRVGAGNVWAPMSADEELGYIYLPTTSATNDMWGGLRPGNNLYANCVVAIDAKRVDGRWEVVVEGGRTPTGRDAVEWAVEATESGGAGEVLLTSIDRDGTGAGYDVDLLRAVSDAVRVPVIASGGAGRVEHFAEALTAGGADAVLAASRFHFEELSIAEVKSYLKEQGIEVRPA